MTRLYWLPEIGDWADRVKALTDAPSHTHWPVLVQLAGGRLDVVQTEKLARVLRRLCGTEAPPGLAAPPIRLALLGSSTVEHLASGIRVAGLRRNLWIEIYTAPYGQYMQELTDRNSGLHKFRPTTVLFSLDARHLVGGIDTGLDVNDTDCALNDIADRLARAWANAQVLGSEVLQQAILPVFPRVLGANEHRLTWSARRLVDELNVKLRQRADEVGIDILEVLEATTHGGLSSWYDPAFWFRAKQEIKPAAAPLYGDLVGRLLAARRGRSAKCLVLDLDNTLWGGVIGDDGMDGVVLGQGSPSGEAHLALQAYARDLSRRGVILAVCSKNDEKNVIEMFERHPEMLLRKGDIACFSVNWSDKATNLRSIAQELNIGLDALVFVDDNPFERNIVRRELPMVFVPELPDDPAEYVTCLTDAGHFEAIAVTAEDTQRSQQYQQNLHRRHLEEAVTDMPSYLRSLSMQMIWKPFDNAGQTRIVQLINKSNQFNLTTRRYTAEQAAAAMRDDKVLSLQLRLVDTFGDNGMISVVICRPTPNEEQAMDIDTWLMSCRVLGRGVEQATMNLVAERARMRGASFLYGYYLPTAKNGMVAEHYRRLGFEHVSSSEDGATCWRFDVRRHMPFATFINTIEG